MGFACSPDIFQANMSELMVTLEFVRTYIDDLLCITKGSLNDHLSKLKRVFIRLRDALLNVNACKSSFCATETDYLGYVLTQDGIKPQKKKVHAILALMLPRSVNHSSTLVLSCLFHPIRVRQYGESMLTSRYQWALHVLQTSSKLRCLS